MTVIDHPLELSERKVAGKGLQSIRAEGMVPAVIHNHGQESILVMADSTLLGKVYNEAGKHHPIELKVGKDEYLALIKDVHFHPVKRRMQHIVFQAIRQDEKVDAEIPIRIDGDMPAEKIGLIVLHQLDTVQVEALPKDLPDELVLDGSKLAELGDKLTVADLVTPSGVTITTEPEHAIATVVEPRAMAVEEESEAEAVEGEESTAGEESSDQQTEE